MIHARQVQHAVQHQDAQFVVDEWPKLGGLRRGAVEGDRDLARRRRSLDAETTARPWRNPCRGICDSARAIRDRR